MGEHAHGHYLRYKAGCHCAACIEAWREWMRDYNHRTGRARPREVYIADIRAANDTHGREKRYNRGCRCADCTAAMTAARRARRQRAAAVKGAA